MHSAFVRLATGQQISFYTQNPIGIQGAGDSDLPQLCTAELETRARNEGVDDQEKTRKRNLNETSCVGTPSNSITFRTVPGSARFGTIVTDLVE